MLTSGKQETPRYSVTSLLVYGGSRCLVRRMRRLTRPSLGCDSRSHGTRHVSENCALPREPDCYERSRCTDTTALGDRCDIETGDP